MIAVLASFITAFTGGYKTYNALPAWVHGVCDFTAGLCVGWVWRWWHGPIL